MNMLFAGCSSFIRAEKHQKKQMDKNVPETEGGDRWVKRYVDAPLRYVISAQNVNFMFVFSFSLQHESSTMFSLSQLKGFINKICG